MFKKMSLKVKLIALFLLIGLVPAVVISLLAYRSTAEQLREDAFRQLEMFAVLSEEHMEKFMDDKEAELKVLTASRDVYQSMNVLRETGWDTTDPRWHERLRILKDFVPVVLQEFDYEFFFLATPAGEIVYSTHEQMLGADFSGRDYMQNALEGRLAWSEIFKSDVVNENVFAICIPIKSNGVAGEVVGALTLALDQNLIDAHAHADIDNLGRTADAYLLDADGLLLTDTLRGEYARDAALQQRINTQASELLSEPIKSGNYDFFLQEEHKNYLGNEVLAALSVTRIGDKPAGFVVEVEAAEVLAGVARMRNLMVTIALVCAALIAGTAYYIATTIVYPVEEVSELTVKLAEGDFTVKALVDSQDEIGKMSEHLNRTVQALSETLYQVQEAANNVSHASSEISSGNQDLSQRTQEQASSLEEIASTIEEIQSSLEASSSNAAQADAIAKGTIEGVHRGEKSMEDLQQAMKEITQGSQEIAEIIATVNDIAFQTNLLALNAAVEAARAGEQGRGFAVVAAEVRNLAGRSADAAKEIEKRIKDSIARVENGNVLMNETESILREIVTDTEKAGDVVGEIAAALQEQAAAQGDIREAIEELNQVTQQNASLVEEIASSSENMNSEAVELSDRVGFFKLADNGYHNQKRTLKTETMLVQEKNNNRREKFNQKERVLTAVGGRENGFDFNEEDFEKF